MWKLLTGIAFLMSLFVARAQDVEVVLGKTEIAKNEYFTITAKVKGGNIKSISPFPNIPGFRNAGTSSSSSTNIINGKMSSEVSYIQRYRPTKEGTFKLNSFSMKINGKVINVNGATIKVGPEKKVQRRQWDPFRDFFDRSNESQEFMDVKDDAFFAISTDKNEVYEGEGVTYTMAFYVSEKNRAQMNFFKLDEQMKDILARIKPKNAWEESFRIQEIKPRRVTINDKKYSKYTIYQARFYPLNEEDLIIPVAGLKMVKYKVARRRSFWGNNYKEDFKTFYSKSKKITVKPLPDHPLKDEVSVGQFRLEDALSTDTFESGKSFNYQFRIRGQGNISSIKEPQIKDDEGLQIYPPNEKMDINRSQGMVAGQRIFDYYVVPEEPGQYDFEKIFSWIYFDPYREVYDTLHSDIVINVTGESMRNKRILSTDFGDFYQRIQVENKVVSLEENINWYSIISIALIGVSIASVIIYTLKT